MDNQEIWKPIVGFEGFYEISSFGRLKKLWEGVSHNIPKGIVDVKINYDGYRYAYLCDGEKKSLSIFVHRLVAQSFIENPENKPQVNHINGNKLDNNVKNLEWATNSENQLHAYRIGLQKKPTGVEYPLYGRKTDKSKNKALKPVKCLSTGKVYLSIKDAAEDKNISRFDLAKSLRGALNKDFGFEYATNI